MTDAVKHKPCLMQRPSFCGKEDDNSRDPAQLKNVIEVKIEGKKDK